MKDLNAKSVIEGQCVECQCSLEVCEFIKTQMEILLYTSFLHLWKKWNQ